MPEFFAHPTALVESSSVGAGTRVWAFAHIMRGASIGPDCNIGDHAFIEGGVVMGRGVTVKNGVCLWDGVTVEDYAFIGPCAVFTNDLRPRSPRSPASEGRYMERAWLVETKVREGASIGANATIRCGVTLGRYCMVGAGSVVTKDVPAFTLVVGNPAKSQGRIDKAGRTLKRAGQKWIEPGTGRAYRFRGDDLLECDA